MAGPECSSKTTPCHPEPRRRGGTSYNQQWHFGSSLCDEQAKWRSFSRDGGSQDDELKFAGPYASSLRSRRVTAACKNLPQLELSRSATCSRALRIAISDTASTTHSKFASPTLAASASGAGLQKSIASGTPS